ncbi:MAG: polysaccharide deacetylase family protein [Calothrix sp. MO_192.B10]|nr:polysaccharide deacetylase family protein [Calothrix sp. MO_192.B10]
MKRRPQDILFPKQYFGTLVKQLKPIPAYFYHQIEAQEFALICELLMRRGFRTVTFGDILDNSLIDSPALLLTMDDGWSSVWSVAFPLARRYGVRFTLFVAPQMIEDSQECRSTLDDGVDPDSLIARDLGSRCMLTWGEVRAMHESGLVEVQSHSLHHGVVFTSPHLSGFSTPDKPFSLPGNVPLVSRLKGKDVPEWHPCLGTPIYPLAPALAAPRRFIENESFKEQCIALIQQNGGADFFMTEGWQDILQKTLTRLETGVWESEDERRDRYRQDLLQAKLCIEERLPGAYVRAFAPPWGAMHTDIPAIAQETGHKVLVLTYPLPSFIKESPLTCYPRLKGDAIWMLLEGPIHGSISWWKAHKRALARKMAGANP